MSNAKPRLSPWSRLLLVERVLSGRPAAHVAAEMGVSRATAYKWLRRFRDEGAAGLLDRSSRPRTSPHRTDPATEAAIVALRRDRRLGPARIAGILELNPSTVHRVLVRHEMPRLSWLDRPTGQLIRRYEKSRPGELVHVDVKKLGALRDGGGWHFAGRDSLERRRSRHGTRVGYDYVHCAIDDHTRLAYAEIHPDETTTTCSTCGSVDVYHAGVKLGRLSLYSATTRTRQVKWLPLESVTRYGTVTVRSTGTRQVIIDGLAIAH
jgi:transposase-like protein